MTPNQDQTWIVPTVRFTSLAVVLLLLLLSYWFHGFRFISEIRFLWFLLLFFPVNYLWRRVAGDPTWMGGPIDKNSTDSEKFLANVSAAAFAFGGVYGGLLRGLL
jgi:hypothetical protein